MRIIAGTLRSRLIQAPPGMNVRPTSDRTRETLFNVLAPDIDGARFLDLFAGAGGVGIEAISRGAREAVLVESNKRAARSIRDNLNTLKVADQALVVEQDVAKALTSLSGTFDIVFLDPPYSLHKDYEETLNTLGRGKLLSPDAIVVAEHEKRYTPPEDCGNLHCYRRLVQGEIAMSFYRQSS
jgi:16S rRNA (guanine966-N2)-methyltransferase